MSPKAERFPTISMSPTMSPLLDRKLPSPFGRTRFAPSRGARRAFWLVLVTLGLVLLWHHDLGVSRERASTMSRVPLILNHADAQPKLSSRRPSISTPDGSTPYSPFYGGASRRAIDISSDPLPLDATLKQRLDAWERAPGAGAPGDVEPPDFVGWNLEQCGAGIEHQLNRHMVEHFSIGWASLNRTAIGALRKELIAYMRSVENSFEMRVAHRLTGRGIVMLAGDGTSLNRVLWSVNMIRSYGSQLPVNV